MARSHKSVDLLAYGQDQAALLCQHRDLAGTYHRYPLGLALRLIGCMLGGILGLGRNGWSLGSSGGSPWLRAAAIDACACGRDTHRGAIARYRTPLHLDHNTNPAEQPPTRRR